MNLSVKVKSVEFISNTRVDVRIKIPGRGCIHMIMDVKEDFWKKLEAELKSAQLIERLHKGPGHPIMTQMSNPLS